ncbi:hypothetical protein BSKO_04314 [Bryopsis sp. KO-2023]|nr:hypothetical protein BSKO_04314 [Bryopsis sp. KO-2023]
MTNNISATKDRTGRGCATGPLKLENQNLANSVVLDGSLFDTPAAKIDNKRPTEECQINPTGTLILGKTGHVQIKTRCPVLTPPTVSGISCAPIQDREGLLVVDQVGKDGGKRLQAGKGLPAIRECCFQVQNRRDGDARPDQQEPIKCYSDDLQSIVAQGHAVRLLQEDSQAMMLFREINDGSDESRGPTPFVNFEALRGNPESRGPLGPLTPEPLSPNVLCVVGNEAGNQQQSLWDHIDGLPDMQSIYVSSPGHSSSGKGLEHPTTKQLDPASVISSNPSTSSGGSAKCHSTTAPSANAALTAFVV